MRIASLWIGIVCIACIAMVPTHAKMVQKNVSDVSFVTTENGTRIQIGVSGPVQIARQNLKGYVAFTVSPARYVNPTNQISIQNPFVEFIYAVQRTDQDVYILIKMKKTDQVTKILNQSGEKKIIVEILDRPAHYPPLPSEKKIPSERMGAPYTPESELS